MPKPISKLSAVVAFRLWMDHHSGIPPTADECVPQNGLPHYSTYRQHFGGMMQVRQLALRLSALDLSAWQLTAEQSRLKTRRCLVCDRVMQLPEHLWRCEACRRQCAAMHDEEPVMTKATLKHFGIEEDDY